MQNTLILGYGNYDRQDDGVAWHILAALAERLGCPFMPNPGNTSPSPEAEEELPSGRPVDLLFDLQLLPETADLVAAYARVCFVDAHTGQVPEEVHFSRIEPAFQNSPFTHHMTPATLLSLVQTIHGRAPDAALASVRGYYFGFSQELSDESRALVEPAVEQILRWLGEKY